MIEQGEALLAATGLRRVLSGKPPTKQDVERSIRLEDDMRDAVAAYLKGKKADRPAFQDYDLPGQLPADASGAVGKMVPEAAAGFGLAAARALAYLNSILKPRAVPGLGVKVASTPGAERAMLRRAKQAIESPVGVLADIDGLTIDHVTAIKAAYPTLFAALGLAAGEATAAAGRALTTREERAIGRLQAVQVADVASVQALHRAEKAAPRTGGRGAMEHAPMATPLQRIASG